MCQTQQAHDEEVETGSGLQVPQPDSERPPEAVDGCRGIVFDAYDTMIWIVSRTGAEDGREQVA